MAESGVAVYGKIVSKEPENQGLIRYRYNVNGSEYSGARPGGRDEIYTGQKVAVTYNPQNPAESILDYYYPVTDGFTIYLLTAAFTTIPTLMIFVMLMGMRHVIRERRRDRDLEV